MGYDSPWKGEEEQFLTEPTYPLKLPYPHLHIYFSRRRLAPKFWHQYSYSRDTYRFYVWVLYRQRVRASVPWDTVFVAYQIQSMLGGLEQLKGWNCNLLSCWNEYSDVLELFKSSPVPQDGLSSQLECTRYLSFQRIIWFSFLKQASHMLTIKKLAFRKNNHVNHFLLILNLKGILYIL